MSTELSSVELAQIETRLSALSEELQREIRAEKREVQEAGESQADEFLSQHEGDLGSDLFLEERALSTQRTLQAELSVVQTALERMSAGTYGVCMDCGSAIPLERLQARPHSIRCIVCEQSFEHEQR